MQNKTMHQHVFGNCFRPVKSQFIPPLISSSPVSLSPSSIYRQNQQKMDASLKFCCCEKLQSRELQLSTNAAFRHLSYKHGTCEEPNVPQLGLPDLPCV